MRTLCPVCYLVVPTIRDLKSGVNEDAVPMGYQVVPTIWDLKSGVNEDTVPCGLSGGTYHMGFKIWRQ